MAKIVLVRKRGKRKDGHNYVATCTICNGSKRDVSGVSGVSKDRAEEMALNHCDSVHYGQRTI
jgi:hypothetical protein